MKRKVLHINLKAIPSGNIDTFEVKVDSRIKDEAKKEKYIEENKEKQFKKRAENPSTADIAVLSAAFDFGDIETFSINNKQNLTEKDLLVEFSEWVLENKFVDEDGDLIDYDIYWSGFDIGSFELSILFKKCIKYKLYKLAQLIPKGSFNKQIVDSFEMWTGGLTDFKSKTTLVDVQKYLAIDDAPVLMKSEMVYDCYINDNMDDIMDYCEKDLMQKREIYNIISPGVIVEGVNSSFSFNKKNMPKKILHMDLETIPSGNIDDIEVKVDSRIKDEVKKAQFIKDNKEKQFRDRAKNPSTADIIVASAAFDHEGIMSFVVNKDEDLSEEDLLTDFSEWIEENRVLENHDGVMEYEILWCGFNIRSYDLNIIFKKCIKYRLYPLAKLISRKRYDKKVLDLLEMWTGSTKMDLRGGNKMKDVREYLDLPGKTAGMDGSMVYDFYLDGRIDDITHYCECDVQEERELYDLMLPGMEL